VCAIASPCVCLSAKLKSDRERGGLRGAEGHRAGILAISEYSDTTSAHGGQGKRGQLQHLAVQGLGFRV
jgi:hypothetical protein